MFSKYFLVGVILAFFATATAFADGEFYGTITYKNCDCDLAPNGDRVQMTSEENGGGPHDYCDVDCWGPGYNTMSGCPPYIFPPGWYTLRVVLGNDSECYFGIPRLIYHGSEPQEVNLVVKGPETMPDGDDE